MDKSGLFLLQINGQEAFVCVGSVGVWVCASVSLHETWTGRITLLLVSRARNQGEKRVNKISV